MICGEKRCEKVVDGCSGTNDFKGYDSDVIVDNNPVNDYTPTTFFNMHPLL
jgi:hypothetical protein